MLKPSLRPPRRYWNSGALWTEGASIIGKPSRDDFSKASEAIEPRELQLLWPQEEAQRCMAGLSGRGEGAPPISSDQSPTSSRAGKEHGEHYSVSKIHCAQVIALDFTGSAVCVSSGGTIVGGFKPTDIWYTMMVARKH